MTQNILKLSLILTVFFTVFNCEKNDQSIIDESQLEQKTPLVINKTIPFEQTAHFNTLQNKISKLQTKISNIQSQNRTSDEDITILTDAVLYVTYASTHTYTFKVLRDVPQAYIENITLHYDINTEDYNEYLVQYHVTAEQYDALYGGTMLENSEHVTITALDNGFFNSNTQSRGCDRVCETIFISCGSGEHHSGNVGEWGSCTASEGPSAYQSCSTQCDQDNDITAPDGDNGGGGDSNGGGNTTVVSNPLPNEPCNNSSTGDLGIKDSTGGCVTLQDDECNSDDSITAELNSVFGEGNTVTDCNIDPDTIPDALRFDTLEELEAFVEELRASRALAGNTSVPNGNNSVTEIVSFSDILLNYNLHIIQTLGNDYQDFSDYSVEVESDISGITAFVSWQQNSYSNSVNGYQSVTEVNGTATLSFIYKNVGKVMSDQQHFRVTTNATDGSFISKEWISFWDWD